MPLEPKIPKQKTAFLTKQCARCGATKAIDDFTQTRSIFYDGHVPVCNGCITDYLRANEFSWDAIDSVCRWTDIPFIVKEWTRLCELNGEERTWPVYARVFAADAYKSIGWADYFTQYKKLREVGLIEDEIPLVNEKRMKDLRRKWGHNYDDEDLLYLEDLYRGLLTTQNVNGALQIDQAQKLCKLSLEIDSRIRAGDKEVDKFLASYDKLVKTAGFTPKNMKNAVDFDSWAEVGHWLEKRGHINKFYDGTTRDVIDETLKNITSYNQRLYVNEGGIGDEITQRLEALKHVAQAEENIFGTAKEYDLEEYENQGYTFEDNDTFEVDEDEQYE